MPRITESSNESDQNVMLSDDIESNESKLSFEETMQGKQIFGSMMATHNRVYTPPSFRSGMRPSIGSTILTR